MISQVLRPARLSAECDRLALMWHHQGQELRVRNHGSRLLTDSYLGGRRKQRVILDKVQPVWTVLRAPDQENPKEYMDLARFVASQSGKYILVLLTPPFVGNGADVPRNVQ